MPSRPAPSSSVGYQIFMMALCIYSLAMLAYLATKPDPTTAVILEYADFAVCLIFLGDFVYSLVRAEDRWAYLRR